jgi:pathogenesis-related protein 1
MVFRAGTAQAAPGVVRPAAARVAPPSKNSAPAVSAADQQALVAAHNTARAVVGAPPLAWNPALATYAQNHLKTLVPACTLAHSGGAYGENLASWTGAAPVTQAVTLRAAEKAQYQGAGGPCQGPSDGAGHYTQVIWGATTTVGCARATCTKNGTSWVLVAFNYAPRGNVLGQPVY